MVFYSSFHSTTTLLSGSAALGFLLILFDISDVLCRWVVVKLQVDNTKHEDRRTKHEAERHVRRGLG